MLNSSPDEPVDPYHFVVPMRLDIAVKALLFEHMKHGLHDPRVERVYRRHIEGRTRGYEKRSWKTSVQDYLQAARDLLTSMKAHGFDSEQPIELGDNLNIRGGAHRIACALVLGEPVHVRIADKPGKAALWDDCFMLAHGLSEADLAPVCARYARLEDAARLRIGD